jgi:Tfp pilus assembly protein PilW
MVAAAIMGIVMVYIMSSFTTQRDTYAVVEQVSEAQQNTRAIAGLVERDLRSAGYMVPAAAAACGRDSNSAADTLFVSDWNAIAPADQLTSALHSQELGSTVSGTPGTGSSVSISVDDVIIDGTASYSASGTNSDFQLNGGAILVDVNNPGRGCAAGIVTSVPSATSVVVDMPTGLGATITAAPDLRLIPATVYQVITPPGSTIPELQRNGTTFARNVEDLQLAWFYDDDDDGQVGSNEYRGGVGNAYDSSTVDGTKLREVRFNLVLRTGDTDPRNSSSAGRGQARENRVSGSVPDDDGRRRRVHTSTIRLRNVR